MTYTITIRRDEDGNYCVTVPALDGCYTFGSTLPEALRMAEEAIVCHLEALADDGIEPPPNVDPVSVHMDSADRVELYRLRVPEAAVNA